MLFSSFLCSENLFANASIMDFEYIENCSLNSYPKYLSYATAYPLLRSGTTGGSFYNNSSSFFMVFADVLGLTDTRITLPVYSPKPMAWSTWEGCPAEQADPVDSAN